MKSFISKHVKKNAKHPPTQGASDIDIKPENVLRLTSSFLLTSLVDTETRSLPLLVIEIYFS